MSDNASSSEADTICLPVAADGPLGNVDSLCGEPSGNGCRSEATALEDCLTYAWAKILLQEIHRLLQLAVILRWRFEGCNFSQCVSYQVDPPV